MKIVNIIGREILDSRGDPTVEVDVILENGILGRFSVPSGASTGSKEALELRDGDKRFGGKGVLRAVNNINTVIKNSIVGMDVNEQEQIDKILIELDGSSDKSNLGANAILGVSGAIFKAAALSNGVHIFEHAGNGKTMPLLMVNIINGGRHADNNISFQEFMIVPVQENVSESIRVASEVFHSLKKILFLHGFSTAVGDEGGFAPNLKDNYEVLDLIMEAIREAGYNESDVKLALDVAASEFYENGYYYFDNNKYSRVALLEYYEKLITQYPIISIEDPVDERDYELFSLLTQRIGDRVMLVGDDLFVTNKEYLKRGIECGAGNAILIKPNQIGTITEMLETINFAKEHKYVTIISHRSGETEDTIIADLSVGLSIPYIKTGSMSRGERICKYNQLMRIEQEYVKD